MLNFRRQRKLSDSLSFGYTEGKLSLQPAFLASSVVISGLNSGSKSNSSSSSKPDESDKKKFLSENPLLRSAHEKAQEFFSFEGTFASLALISGDTPVLFVGTGSTKDFYAKNLLHLGGKIAGQVDRLKNGRFIFLVDSFFRDLKNARNEAPKDFAGRELTEKNLTREEALERLLTGFLLGLYKTPSAKNTDKKPKNDKPLEILLASKILTKEKVLHAAKLAMNKAEATYWARDRGAVPPNVLTPEVFAKEIRELGEESGFKCKVLDEVRLQKEGFGGIWSVGKGSINPPRLVIAEYNATHNKVPHLVLIGKGVTFDTGGISLKPPPGMHEMKHDMTGAAVVCATLSAIAKEKLPIKVTALLPLVENRPSHNSFLPGDVYEAWGGSSVEVQNTDAEGRLLLADCLAYAQALKGDLVMDLATLTGAASITIGPAAFLLYGNSAEWTHKFQKVVRHAGEESWELPLFPEYSEDLKSNVAHIRNHVGHRDGNSHIAAAFLNYFVDNKYPWLHLDICAYTLYTKWKGAHCPPDAAVGLPTLAMVEFARSLAKK